jgi:putative ABC transport system permease protein
MSIAGLIRKNAFGNKRRSILTILGISFSLLLLTTFMNVWSGFFMDHGTPESARRLITRNRISIIFFLPIHYRDKIRLIPGVTSVVNLTWFESQYKDDSSANYFAKFGTDPNEFFDVYPEYRIPQEQLTDWQHDRSGCVVDAFLAKRLHWKVGDHLHLKGKLFPASLELTIRGIFTAPRHTEAIYFNDLYLDEAYPPDKGLVGFFVVNTSSFGDTHAIASAIDGEFRNYQRATKTGSEQSFHADYVAMLGNVKAFILWVCLAVVFATLLASANTMAMTIRERTRETAVLKSLGFPGNMLLRFYIGEAVVLSLIGGLLGSLAGSVLVWAIARSPQGTLLFAGLKAGGPIILVSLLISVLLGILSSCLPAYRVSRINVATGLHHIG